MKLIRCTNNLGERNVDIKDCKIGARVVCVECENNVIPVGAVGTIIENDSIIPWVSFDTNYSIEQQEVFGYSNCKVMELDELEVLEENPLEEDSSKETNLGKLSVSLSTEDTNEIAKDILKVVLQELYVGIEALSVSLSKDSDEGEISSEVSGDITPKESLVTEQDVLDNLLYSINIAVYNNDGDTALKLSEAYQRIKSVQMI